MPTVENLDFISRKWCKMLSNVHFIARRKCQKWPNLTKKIDGFSSNKQFVVIFSFVVIICNRQITNKLVNE